MSRETAVESGENPAVQAGLARLIALVEGSRVEAARVLVQELASKWPESEAIQHWRRVLEPPRTSTRKAPPVEPLIRERDWLRAHAHKYPGCWLALSGDRLIAAYPDRARVVTAARAACGDGRFLLFFQPKVKY